MDVNELYQWKGRIEKRKDLEHMLAEKHIVIHFHDEQDIVGVMVDGKVIKILEHEQQQPNVTIHAQFPVLQNIWNGNKRLLTLPEQTIQAKGPFRDLLFVEALFHLAS